MFETAPITNEQAEQLAVLQACDKAALEARQTNIRLGCLINELITSGAGLQTSHTTIQDGADYYLRGGPKGPETRASAD